MQKDFFPVHLGHLGLRIFLWRLFFPLNLYFTLYLLALQLVLIVGALGYGRFLKSANLQYNTLVRWADEINDSWTKRLMFFHKTLHNSLQKPFQFIILFFFFFFFCKITKNKIKISECPKSIRNYEKRNTWQVRCLLDKLFVPPAQQTSELYCRLLDFSSQIEDGLVTAL